METWKLLAAIPPIIVWIVFFLYSNKLDMRLKKVEEELANLGGASSREPVRDR